MMRMQPDQKFTGAPVPSAAAPIAIELSGASVTFGRGERAVPALSTTTLRIADGEFVANMEEVLATYVKAYDPACPVVCMDEQPVQLIGETLVPIPATKEHPERVDYEYERKGTASIFMFAEPLFGFRQATARPRRRAWPARRVGQPQRRWSACGGACGGGAARAVEGGRADAVRAQQELPCGGEHARPMAQRHECAAPRRSEQEGPGHGRMLAQRTADHERVRSPA